MGYLSHLFPSATFVPNEGRRALTLPPDRGDTDLRALRQEVSEKNPRVMPSRVNWHVPGACPSRLPQHPQRALPTGVHINLMVYWGLGEQVKTYTSPGRLRVAAEPKAR